MKTRIDIPLLLVAIWIAYAGFALHAQPSPPAEVPRPSFEQANREAAATNRPLVVLLSAAWCPACQWCEQNQSLMAALRRHGVLAVVDVDQRPDLKAAYLKGRPLPCLRVYPRFPGGWGEPTTLIGGDEMVRWFKISAEKPAK
jgi:thiol:disulfide interchange protein